MTQIEDMPALATRLLVGHRRRMFHTHAHIERWNAENDRGALGCTGQTRKAQAAGGAPRRPATEGSRGGEHKPGRLRREGGAALVSCWQCWCARMRACMCVCVCVCVCVHSHLGDVGVHGLTNLRLCAEEHLQSGRRRHKAVRKTD